MMIYCSRQLAVGYRASFSTHLKHFFDLEFSEVSGPTEERAPLVDFALASTVRLLFQYAGVAGRCLSIPIPATSLIFVVAKASLVSPELAKRLRSDSHRVVLSLETLIELAAPLRNGLLLEVRKDLNQLEELPLVFVNEGRIRI